MIHLFASDLDDTLLNSYKQISPTNVAAIHALQQSGVEFILASGRTYSSMHNTAQSAGFNCAYICLGGAEYWDSDGICKERLLFPAELAEKSLRFVEEIGGACICYCASRNYFYPSAERYRQLLEPTLRHLVKIPSERVPMLINEIMMGVAAVPQGDIPEILGHKLVKLDCVFGNTDALLAAGRKFSQYDQLCCVMPQQSRLEMTHIGASKADMLQKVAQRKGSSLLEVAAIGDSDNDLAMLSAVKYSFAVSNAEEHVKSVCRYVVAHYEEDGVAEAIRLVMELNKTN